MPEEREIEKTRDGESESGRERGGERERARERERERERRGARRGSLRPFGHRPGSKIRARRPQTRLLQLSFSSIAVAKLAPPTMVLIPRKFTLLLPGEPPTSRYQTATVQDPKLGLTHAASSLSIDLSGRRHEFCGLRSMDGDGGRVAG
jgi:hypothetical protein